MKRSLVAVIAVVALSQVAAKSVTGDVFWVYQDMSCPKYIPSGYMGDFGDIRMNSNWKQKPASGPSCMKVIYSAERKQGAGWAGVYFQNSVNNWGDKKGGFDLTGFKKLKFMARGEKGNEQIDDFKVGGITGQTEDGDTDQNSTGPISLTKDWKEYEIKLDGMDLSHIIGGFCFVLGADSNYEGAVFFLDEIRFEK